MKTEIRSPIIARYVTLTNRTLSAKVRKLDPQPHVLIAGTLLVCIAIIATGGTLLGQGWAGSNPGALSSNPITYDPKIPPPVALPEAYSLALSHIGTGVNSFHCGSNMGKGEAVRLR